MRGEVTPARVSGMIAQQQAETKLDLRLGGAAGAGGLAVGGGGGGGPGPPSPAVEKPLTQHVINNNVGQKKEIKNGE